jgi:tRNA threonylcarbamoyladenosine biosynthesis protein TsaE
MPSKKTKTSKSVKETGEIAKIFLEETLNQNTLNQNALVVGLVGGLGAGKTTFLQAIAKHLGVKEKISSPTFVIMKKYPLPLRRRSTQRAKGSGFDFLFHLDAYRLKNEKELLHLGWEEIIKNKKHLIFIEWPENVSKIMPAHSKFIHISDQKDGQKLFKFK